MRGMGLSATALARFNSLRHSGVGYRDAMAFADRVTDTDLATAVAALPTTSSVTAVANRATALERPAVSSHVDDYGLAASDVGTVVDQTKSTANTVTVTKDLSTSTWPLNASAIIRQSGAGQVTVVADSGVTLNLGGATAKLAQQFAEAKLTRIAANVYNLNGELAAS